MMKMKLREKGGGPVGRISKKTPITNNKLPEPPSKSSNPDANSNEKEASLPLLASSLPVAARSQRQLPVPPKESVMVPTDEAMMLAITKKLFLNKCSRHVSDETLEEVTLLMPRREGNDLILSEDQRLIMAVDRRNDPVLLVQAEHGAEVLRTVALCCVEKQRTRSEHLTVVLVHEEAENYSFNDELRSLKANESGNGELLFASAAALEKITLYSETLEANILPNDHLRPVRRHYLDADHAPSLRKHDNVLHQLNLAPDDQRTFCITHDNFGAAIAGWLGQRIKEARHVTFWMVGAEHTSVEQFFCVVNTAFSFNDNVVFRAVTQRRNRLPTAEELCRRPNAPRGLPIDRFNDLATYLESVPMVPRLPLLEQPLDEDYYWEPWPDDDDFPPPDSRTKADALVDQEIIRAVAPRRSDVGRTTTSLVVQVPWSKATAISHKCASTDSARPTRRLSNDGNTNRLENQQAPTDHDDAPMQASSVTGPVSHVPLVTIVPGAPAPRSRTRLSNNCPRIAMAAPFAGRSRCGGFEPLADGFK